MASPRHGGGARLGIVPRYVRLGSNSYAGEPINRLRLTARNVSTNEVVGTLVVDVDPETPNWDLGLDVTLDAPIIVVITIELINVTDGIETVQWSGLSDPISVSPAEPLQTSAPVTLYQGPPANLQVTGVTIVPDSVITTEGIDVPLTAMIAGPSGARAIWSSEDTNIAVVDQNGVLTGLRDGITRVIAEAGPKSDTARVIIRQRIGSVAVSPDTQRVGSLDAEVSFTARALDPRGAEISGAALTWSAANAEVLESLGNGRFRTRANGSSQIFAASTAQPAIRGTGVVVVAQHAARVELDPLNASLNALGARQEFQASVFDANNRPMSVPLRWRSSHPQVATVDSLGAATAVGSGSTEIAAIAGSGADTIVGRATLQVVQTISTVQVTPNPVTLNALGATQQFSASVRDANGNVVEGAQVAWSTANPGVATVDDNGLATARTVGTTTVIATAGTVLGTATLNVQQAVHSITLAPQLDTIAPAETTSFTATARDALNNVVPTPVLTWTSTDTTVATVDATGLVLGRAPGTATIRATSGSASATATVVVASVVPARVTITPDTLRLNAIGAEGQLSAAAFDALDHVLPDTHIAWSSLDPEIATVDDSGHVTAVAPGHARIVALATAADTAIVIVKQVAASLTVTPDSATLALGDSVRLTAIVRDSSNVNIADAAVTWQSSDTTVARVDAAGFVHAFGGGSAQVSAHYAGLSDAAQIHVLAPDLTVLAINTTPADTVNDGDSVHVSVTVKNIGAAPAGATSLTVQLFDAGTDALLRALTVPLPALPAGVALPLTGAYVLTSDTPWPDSLYARAVVDSLDVVRESTETNNTLRSAVRYVRFAVQRLTLTPDTLHLAPGATGQLTATAYDRLERALDRPVVFVSLNEAVAGVDDAGVVIAHSAGTAQIVARSESSADTSVVVVAAPNLLLRSISVEPATLRRGDSLTVTSVVVNTGDAAAGAFHVDLDAGSNAPSGFPLYQRVDSLAAGDSIAVTFRLLVEESWPDTITFSSTADANGELAESDETDNSATAAPFAIGAVAVAQVTLSPDSLVFNALDLVALVTATVTDRDGNVLSDRTVTFSSTDNAIAGIDQTGHVRANAVGSAYLIAEVEGVRDSIPVRVQQVPAYVVITPDTVRLAPGDTMRLHADVFDSNGYTLPVLPVWSSDNAAATVDADGLVQARGVGTANIIASYEGVADTAAVIIAAANLTWVRFTATPDTLHEGGTVLVRGTIKNTGNITAPLSRLRLSVLDAETGEAVLDTLATLPPIASNDTLAFAFTLPIDTLIAWPDSVIGKAVLDATNVVAEVAETDNESATPPHVIRFRVASVQASPGRSVLIAVGDTVRIEAKTFDRYGRELTDRAVTFTSRDTEVATVDADGLVHATGADSTYIVAMSEGRSDSVLVVVAQTPRALFQVSGNAQTGTVNQIVQDSLSLRVVDGNGVGVKGVEVQWTPGAGTIALTQFDGFISGVGAQPFLPPFVSFTDANGVARAHWQLGTRAGPQQVTACVAGLSCVTFTGSARPDKPNNGAKRKGDEQFATVGTTAGDSLILEVRDQFENPVPDATVRWVVSNGGTLSDTVSVTDSLGIAMVQYSVDRVKGRKSVEARVYDDANIVATETFRLNGKAGAPHGANKRRGGGLTGTVSPTLGDTLQVQVLDEYGNGVDSVEVTFSVQGGGGKLNGLDNQVVMTDTAGIASIAWTLGTRAGLHRLRATVAGLALPLEFENTARAGRPNKGHRKDSSDNQQVTVNQVAPNALELTVTDEYDNPVADALVQWAVDANAGTLSDSSTYTDSAGLALVRWVVPQTRGSYFVHYSVRDTAANEVVDTGSYRVVAKPDKPHHHAKRNESDNQDVTVAQTAPNALEITVFDQFSNPVPDAIVTFAIRSPNGSPSLSAAADTTDDNGKASVSWNVGTKAGKVYVDYAVLSGDDTIATGTFSANAHAGPPSQLQKKTGDNQNGIVASQLGGLVTIEVKDTYGNPVPGVLVEWQPQSGEVNAPDSTTTTDTTGVTGTRWTLGTERGTQTLLVLVHRSETAVDTLTFTATARPGNPQNQAALQLSTGAPVHVNTTRVVKFSTDLLDQFGNKLDSNDVTWSVCAGRAQCTGQTASITQASIAPSTPATTPPSASIQLKAAETITVTAWRGASPLGFLTLSVQP